MRSRGRVRSVGDLRFDRKYAGLRDAADRAAALRFMPDEDVVESLAAASRASDAMISNILATEAVNRMRRLRAALANLGEGVIAMSADTTVQWMNAAAEEILEWSRKDAIERRFVDVIHHLDASREPIAPDHSPILRAAREGARGSGDGEFFRTPVGHDVCVAYNSAPIFAPDDSIQGIVLGFHDCGARIERERALRESQQFYKSLFEQLPTPVITVGLDGQIVDANPPAQAITQRPIAESRGKPFLEFVHPDDKQRASELFAAVVAGRPQTGAMRILTRSGRFVRAETMGFPVLLDGRVVGVHGLITKTLGSE